MSHHDVDPSVDPIEALRAELSRVEVSSGFAERVRRKVGEDVIASIGAELSELSVSPEFAVRVRQQIDEAPARSRWFGMFNWRWAVPVAAAAMIAAMTLTRDGTATPDGVDPAPVQARGPEQQAPQAPKVPETPSMESIGAMGPVSQSSQAAAAPVKERTTTPAAASGRQVDDMLEVITNQPALLRRLWARVGPAGELVGTLEGVSVAAGEIVIPPIEVNPIVVKSLIDPDATAPGSTPIIRRVTAEPAERSSR